MEKLIVRQSCVQGIIEVRAAKNAVLPILACSIMCKSQVVIHNVSQLTDTLKMIDIIKSIGGQAEFDGSDLVVNCVGVHSGKIDDRLTKDMRASIFILGALCNRVGQCTIGYPGGCDIGKRPIDLHLNSLRQMGVDITEDSCFVDCKISGKLRGANIVLPIKSVGVTENILMAAAIAEGTTTITGGADEPEVVDLANFINACGGSVIYDNKGNYVIKGVGHLHGCNYKPIGDRIIAGTYLVASAISGGDITVCGLSEKILATELDLLKKKGCQISCGNNCIRLVANGRLASTPQILTGAYPMFATDLQPQFMALESVSNGVCSVKEKVFERRLEHAIQLIKMGANISIEGDVAKISGIKRLHGAFVTASDLRGGAALVLAGINASGETIVSNIHYIDRGYYKIEDDLQSVGVDIVRTTN